MDATGPARGSWPRFLAVSALGYGIDLTLLYALQSFGGLPRLINVSIAFWITYVVNFALNRTVTFHASTTDLAGQLRRYVPQVLVDFVLTLGGVELFAGVLGLPLLAARMVAAGANAGFNYTAYRWWTFRRPRADAGRP